MGNSKFQVPNSDLRISISRFYISNPQISNSEFQARDPAYFTHSESQNRESTHHPSSGSFVPIFRLDDLPNEIKDLLGGKRLILGHHMAGVLDPQVHKILVLLPVSI